MLEKNCKINVNRVNSNGHTPLMTAIKHRSIQCICELLDCKDVSILEILNNNSLNAVEYAVSKNRTIIVKMLLSGILKRYSRNSNDNDKRSDSNQLLKKNTHLSNLVDSLVSVAENSLNMTINGNINNIQLQLHQSDEMIDFVTILKQDAVATKNLLIFMALIQNDYYNYIFDIAKSQQFELDEELKYDKPNIDSSTATKIGSWYLDDKKTQLLKFSACGYSYSTWQQQGYHDESNEKECVVDFVEMNKETQKLLESQHILTKIRTIEALQHPNLSKLMKYSTQPR